MDAPPVIEGFWTVPEAADHLRVTDIRLRGLLRRHGFPKRYSRVTRHAGLHRILLTSEVAQLSALILAQCRYGVWDRRVRAQTAS